MHTSVRNGRSIATYLLCCFLLVSCGSGESSARGANEPAPTIATAGPQGYLLSGRLPDNNQGVWFLQWTEANGSLTGQSQNVVASASPSAGTSSNNDGFAGTRNGASVSLRFSASGNSGTITGTISGDTLTILYPDSRSGQFVEYTLRRATAQDYNSAVVTFRQQVFAPVTATAVETARRRATATAVSAQQGAIATTVAPNLLGTWKLVALSPGNAFAPDTLQFEANEFVRGTKAGEYWTSRGGYRIIGPDTMLMAFGSEFTPETTWKFSFANGILTLTHPNGGTSTWKRAP